MWVVIVFLEKLRHKGKTSGKQWKTDRKATQQTKVDHLSHDINTLTFQPTKVMVMHTTYLHKKFTLLVSVCLFTCRMRSKSFSLSFFSIAAQVYFK